MKLTIGLDFCCNNPDNGLFDGRLSGIQLYDSDPVFELEARSERAPLLTRLQPGALRIAGKRWPILEEREWVGNWCWNRYTFNREVAADLLIWAHRRRLFTLSCGVSRLYTAWQSADLAQSRPLLLTLLAEAAG